jgi:hypothetical protein
VWTGKMLLRIWIGGGLSWIKNGFSLSTKWFNFIDGISKYSGEESGQCVHLAEDWNMQEEVLGITYIWRSVLVYFFHDTYSNDQSTGIQKRRLELGNSYLTLKMLRLLNSVEPNNARWREPITKLLIFTQ